MKPLQADWISRNDYSNDCGKPPFQQTVKSLLLSQVAMQHREQVVSIRSWLFANPFCCCHGVAMIPGAAKPCPSELIMNFLELLTCS